ncbi:hypothetical protein YC2023_042403 [Brassica napus]
MACKRLCTLAGRDWADLLETAACAGLTRRDPREDEPAAVRDGTGRTNLFDIPMCSIYPFAKRDSKPMFHVQRQTLYLRA